MPEERSTEAAGDHGSEANQPHSTAAGDEVNSNTDVDWTEAKHYPAFRDLLSAKTRFIVPMLILSLGFYLGVTLLAGLAPNFTSERVIGPLSVDYLLVFATYILTWVVALVYVRVANRDFDSKAANAISELEEQQAQKKQDA